MAKMEKDRKGEQRERERERVPEIDITIRSLKCHFQFSD